MLLGMIVLVAVLSGVQTLLRFVLHAPDALAALTIVAATLGTYIGWTRLVERRRPAELDPRAWPQALAGLAIGLALIAVTIGLLAGLGVYRFEGFGGWAGVGSNFLIFLAGAVFEELLFRGMLFRTLRDLWGTWVGVAASAAVFGLLHAFNPGATVVSTVAIMLEAGVLLAVAYAASNRLWLPIGLHLGWNFAEGPIFGTAVSGHALHKTLLHGSFQGPAWLSGGGFGPEASVVAVLVCLLASAAFAVRVLRAAPEVSSAAAS